MVDRHGVDRSNHEPREIEMNEVKIVRNQVQLYVDTASPDAKSRSRVRYNMAPGHARSLAMNLLEHAAKLDQRQIGTPTRHPNYLEGAKARISAAARKLGVCTCQQYRMTFDPSDTSPERNEYTCGYFECASHIRQFFGWTEPEDEGKI